MLALQLHKLTKSFPGVLALDNVDFSLKEGEIHALVGENGAGKTTLIKVVAGIYKPDEGQVSLFEKEIDIKNPNEARSLGISIIHQERNLIPELSVAENIFLDRYPKTRFGTIDWERLYQNAREIIQQLDLDIDVRISASNISIANQQLIEIANALSLDPKILILDEPTSSLTETETKKLFSILKKLKSRNVSMIYISHRLEELYEIADRITILRDGQLINVHDSNKVSKDILVQEMVGRELESRFKTSKREIGEQILEIKDLSWENRLFNINMEFYRGEIVGIAGLIGAGRTELADCIFHAKRNYSGEIIIDNKKGKLKSINDAIDHGISLVTEDRKKLGLVSSMSVGNNITLASLKKISSAGVISRKRNENIVTDIIKQLDIKTPSKEQLVRNLSGGNQQKVVIGKWLSSSFKIIIFDEPTVGIDVGARDEMYQLIDQLASDNFCVILISSDITEIINLSDRIYVMKQGTVSGELPKNSSQEDIMRLAT